MLRKALLLTTCAATLCATGARAFAQAPPSPPPAPAAQSVPDALPPGSVEVPAGTKVLLALRSGVNTRSAQPGDGVYLSSTFPVVIGNQVAIPAGVYVQGVIDRVTRAGRVKGRAEVGMHFTTMIFPNGSVVSIPGVVNSVPGSSDHKVKNSEGDIQQAGSKGKDAGEILRDGAGRRRDRLDRRRCQRAPCSRSCLRRIGRCGRRRHLCAADPRQRSEPRTGADSRDGAAAAAHAGAGEPVRDRRRRGHDAGRPAADAEAGPYADTSVR